MLEEEWLQSHSLVKGGITCCYTLIGGETPQILASPDLESLDVISYLNIGLCQFQLMKVKVRQEQPVKVSERHNSRHSS